MIIVLKPDATEAQAKALLARIDELGLKSLYMPGTERTVLGAIGDERVIEQLQLESQPIVESVNPVLAPYKLVSREIHPHDTLVQLGDAALPGRVSIGGERFCVIAGPGAIESRAQLAATAEAVQQHGAHVLRGGAFRPRTSPYSFQGLGLEGLRLLHEISRELGLPAVTEVVEAADVEAVVEHVDALLVSAHDMQNYRLLQALGRAGKPVILERGMAATVRELLLAAEHILSEGNPDVVLCERGIRTFETATRSTLDLNAVPYIKQHSHLPVIVDPSQGTGSRDLLAPMARAAAACGADGLMIAVHVDPPAALADGAQSLFPHQLAELMRGLRPFVEAAGRTL